MGDAPNVASNNRTLRLDDATTASLRPRLLRPSQMTLGQVPVDRTVCGDLSDVLPALPDAFADLIIADPPYNLNKTFGDRPFRARTDVEYVAFLEEWLPAVARKLKPTGTMYVCADWRSTAAVQQVLGRELTLMNRITWQREKGRGARANWKNSMEDIWYAVADPHNYHFDIDAVRVRRRVVAPYRRADGQPKDWREQDGRRYRDTCPSNFWDDITVPFWSMAENTAHPTQKPEKLYAKLILASSRAGDVVFDPFLGSGTASVVAHKLGRHYVGVERDETYCLLAEERLRRASTDTAIQGYADGVFWERNSRP